MQPIHTITLDDMTGLATLGNIWPASGFMIIEKINSVTGMFENEVIEYTGRKNN